MLSKPQEEHAWFEPLVGEWTVESECSMGPDQPVIKTAGRVTCRSVDGLWFLIETTGESPEGGSWTSVMTLGYDPGVKRYTGTFIASMMTHLWLYSGALDESGRKLTLECEGPKCNQPGMTRYEDMIELDSDDHWVFSSRMLGDDGKWTDIMTAHHNRVKP